MLTRQHLCTRFRCALVALAATAAAAAALSALVAPMAGPVATVDEALVRLCLAVLTAAVGWAWLASLTVTAEAWRGRVADRRVPVALRRLVLLCCGVALAAPVGAATAEEHRPTTPAGIAGLPLPERATGPAHPRATVPVAPHSAAPRSVVVSPGDCLWHLAAADLPAGAKPERIALHWHAIHRRNASVIGPNPDLIHPGQRLVLPPR